MECNPRPRIRAAPLGTALVPGEGFEPPKALPADLQSAPFGRSGIPACDRPLVRRGAAMDTGRIGRADYLKVLAVVQATLPLSGCPCWSGSAVRSAPRSGDVC